MTVLDLRVVVARLDLALRRSLENAVARAVSRSHANVEIEHWLAELVDREGLAVPVLRTLDVPVDRVAAELALRLDAMRGGEGGAPSLARSILEWIEEAWLTASLRFGRDTIDIVDLLTALTTSSNLGHALRDLAPSLRMDEGKLLALAKAVKPAEPQAGASSAAAVAANRAASEGELERYTVDLTAQARAGRLDPVIGREAELRQVVDILMRRRQNNPILTGEAGVGKTAVVEALALRIAEGTVPEKLRGIAIRSLDLGLLQAGAGVKGEFERRLTGVIAEIKAATVPIILFIDEAHVMIGAGNQAGGSDAANLLKPALARGELRTIAATTWSEYKRHIERDPALTRRFQVVKVGEPSPEMAVRMLRGLVPSLERHHGVRIRDEALIEAVHLSARHLPDRQLPDKAISVLDTAAAAAVISRTNDPPRLEDLGAEMKALESHRDACLRDGASPTGEEMRVIDERLALAKAEHEALATRLADERRLVADLAALEAEPAGEERTVTRIELEERLQDLQGEAPLIHPSVGRDVVAGVIARWTGVPVGKLLRDSIRGAMTLQDRLRERVVGQDRALAVVAAAMRNFTAKLADPRKPPGVFLMVGTSGVGKTETALALADLLYGGAHHLTVLNMSEFKEEHKVSTLVGSPPGYVGYGEGGVLTEAVRRRPYGLLLLDEMEKAHPGVQDVFYQVFDKGVLRDGEGRDIEFLNTTVIMTSNAGSETLAALVADPDTMPEGDALVAALQPDLARYFKPAFLGRVTIVPYVPLGEPVLRAIARLQIERIRERLETTHKIGLDVDAAVEAEIVKRCLSGEIGARAIEGILSREIVSKLSDAVLDHALRGQTPARLRVRLGASGQFEIDVPGPSPEDVPEQSAERPADCGHVRDPISLEADSSEADRSQADLAHV